MGNQLTDDTELANLLNRLESHMRDSKVHLLIKEAVDTIIVQNKRIKDLESIVQLMDAGLCNYINGCEDPYEPASKWHDSNRKGFDELCRVYNLWHESKDNPGDISMSQYVAKQDEIRKSIVRSLKETLYRTKSSAEAQEIIERVIRRYEDQMWSII